MILMIDNYDSFTFNIVQYLGQMGENVEVYRNDKITMEEIKRLKPRAIFLSPGPCTPLEAGITVDVIREFYKDLPIMGICLGHQSIGYAFGGEVVRASRIMHGKISPIINDGKTIFAGLPNPFPAGRYHSLLVARDNSARLFRNQRGNSGGRNNGTAAQGLSRGRNSVPSGIGADSSGKAHH